MEVIIAFSINALVTNKIQYNNFNCNQVTVSVIYFINYQKLQTIHGRLISSYNSSGVTITFVVRGTLTVPQEILRGANIYYRFEGTSFKSLNVILVAYL